MDAGRVQFVSGTELDLKLANGFKNTDVFCVAPITLNGASLASYDFWAVGKNCCSDQMADFRCGASAGLGPKGGVRVTDDVDRDFYRLAVQQAQSAHAIKAVHPLFFEWTENALEQLTNDERVGGSSGPKRKRLRRSSKWIEMACFIEGNHLKAIGHCFSTSTFIFESVPLGHRMFQLYFRSATSVS